MYYQHKCLYCGKLFYTFDDNKEQAARSLYEGIKKHLKDYNEDHKEFEFDEAPSIEEYQMYNEMTETSDEPMGGYEL